MKYPPLKSPCKECELKCFRVENPNFTGDKNCKYAEKRKLETGGNMENKVIAKEYVDANFLHKDLIRLVIKEGMSDAKGIGQEGGAQCIANILLVMIGDKDARTLDSFRI